MANEIQITYTTGQNLYALITNATGQAWNGTAFVTVANAMPSYAQALTESALPGLYMANFPVAPMGDYAVEVRRLIGTAPASTNAAASDPVVGTDTIRWSGSGVISLAALKSAVDVLSAMMVQSAVAASPAPSTTAFAGGTALNSTSNTAYVSSYLVFTSGANAGISHKILTYTPSTRTFTTGAFPVAPTVGDTFSIVGRNE